MFSNSILEYQYWLSVNCNTNANNNTGLDFFSIPISIPIPILLLNAILKPIPSSIMILLRNPGLYTIKFDRVTNFQPLLFASWFLDTHLCQSWKKIFETKCWKFFNFLGSNDLFLKGTQNMLLNTHSNDTNRDTAWSAFKSRTLLGMSKSPNWKCLD